jgi:gas vesicle protein
MRRLALAVTALLVAAGIGCRKKQTTQIIGASDSTPTMATAPAPRDTAPTVRPFGFEQRQEFGQSIRQQLASIDQQIKDLARQAKSRGGAVSDRALANIRASRRAVDRSLTRINTATAANWEQVKRGVNQSVDNLTESIEGAQPK